MQHLNSILGIGALILLSAVLSPASSHDDATLDAMTAPHGGQLRMAGPYHYELVLSRDNAASAKTVTVYLTDHAFQPQPSAGATGTVTIEVGGKKSVIQLKPSGPNELKGVGVFRPSAPLKAVVSLVFSDKSEWFATFTPFAKSTDAQAEALAGHQHHNMPGM